jgi:hypothetical protein
MLKTVIVLENLMDYRPSEKVRRAIDGRGYLLADLVVTHDASLQKVVCKVAGVKVVAEDLQTAGELR